MNRREFLQSIAAFATSVSIPLEVMFYVNEYGALSSDAVETWPATRKALLDYQEVGSRDELLEAAHDHASIADVLECELSDPDWFDEDQEIPKDWKAWLDSADDDTIDRLIVLVNDWINDTPDERDYEIADLGGYSGRGYALRFFQDDFAFCDDLNIVIVEGDSPGSSYFAAELRMDLDDANAVAESLDIPIRFAWQG